MTYQLLQKHVSFPINTMLKALHVGKWRNPKTWLKLQRSLQTEQQVGAENCTLWLQWSRENQERESSQRLICSNVTLSAAQKSPNLSRERAESEETVEVPFCWEEEAGISKQGASNYTQLASVSGDHKSYLDLSLLYSPRHPPGCPCCAF